MIDIRTALQQARALLRSTSESARLDAEILLAHAMQVPRIFLYTHPEAVLTDTQHRHYGTLIAQRVAGQPVAYLTQSREFWSLSLRVNTHTLIPRPDTELLVAQVLTLLADKPMARILDLGTGSGAIALAVASERPTWQITAVDVSAEALSVAQDNARTLGLQNTTFICSHWFDSLPSGRYDAIVSNPPYLAADDPHLLAGDVRFEPHHALVSGVDGLDALRHIIQHARAHLVSGGLLLLEHGYTQHLEVAACLQTFGYVGLGHWQDLQGHVRVSGAYMP